MAIRVLRKSVDQLTGFVQCQIRVEETAPDGTVTIGPEETIGVEAEALFRKFHDPAAPGATHDTVQSAIMRWLQSHHDLALARKRNLEHVHSVVAELDRELVHFS